MLAGRCSFLFLSSFLVFHPDCYLEFSGYGRNNFESANITKPYSWWQFYDKTATHINQCKNIEIMQDFSDQARKNNITLYDKGKCQFCGANYQRGIFDCMDNYNKELEFLDFNNSEYYMSRFLSVDAHALQHPEIHGRWSNHFHLTRLNLILDKKQQWDYRKSPLLSDFLNEYKLNRTNEFLALPKPQERGIITVKDLAKMKTANECVKLTRKWANEVYSAWNSNYTLVSKIADGFLDKN
jgi:Family of unknown function (DUF5946)